MTCHRDSRVCIRTLVVIISIAAAFVIVPVFNEASGTAHATEYSWEKTGTGTTYYASFPSGYNTASVLFHDYSKAALQSYENAGSKRSVTTKRVGWIYWHWTFSRGALPNDNYNVFIEKSNCNVNGRQYQYFTDFYSTQDYPLYDPAGHHDSNWECYYYWRGNVNDGSWWWFRLPVYEQKYTDYKKVVVKTDKNNKQEFATRDGYVFTCVKKGNSVYCCTSKKVLKVRLKKSKKQKRWKTLAGGGSYKTDLSVRKGYLYYIDDLGITGDMKGKMSLSLYRMTLSGKHKKKLASAIDYFIVKDKIYFLSYKKVGKKYKTTYWYAMNLNGTNKKLYNKNPYGLNAKWKECNVAGYQIKNTDVDYPQVRFWLKKPNGKKIKLSKEFEQSGIEHEWLDVY